jgi:hypothetical protein
MKLGIIYKTTNLINGKWYIGKDEDNDPKYFGSGIYLNRAIKKYGKENFKKEIITECEIGQPLADLEKKIIEEANAVKDPMSYNISIGGYGGHTWGGYSQEKQDIIKQKMKKSEEDKKKRRKFAIENNLAQHMIEGRDKGRRKWWESLSNEEKFQYQSKRNARTYILSNIDGRKIITSNLQETSAEIGISYNYIQLCIKKNKMSKGWKFECLGKI